MNKTQYKFLNAAKKKEILAQIDKSINAKEFVLIERENKISITTPQAAKSFLECAQARSVGLLLGEMKNKLVHLSPSAADLFRKK